MESEPLIKKAVSKRSINSFEDALDGPGFGLFHVLLIVVAGWALASDSVEVQCVSFVTPQLSDPEANPGLVLNPSNFQKGLLDAIIFLGMMFGGYFWGSWSDVVGRRPCLIAGLIFNGMFGLASALSPNFYVFLFFRFMSGVGVGGSLPVTFTYFSEFFSTKTRGPFVIVLSGFWIVGSIFASLLALAIIEPLQTRVRHNLGSITITPWRVYIMLCTFPALSGALMLLVLPESPRFLFSKRRLKESVRALNFIREVNSWCVYCYPATIKEPLYLSELDNISAHNSDNVQISFCQKIQSVLKSTGKLFTPTHLRPSLVLCTVWFTFSFGYYGLLLWFPEYFKRIQEQEPNVTSSTSNSSIYVDSLCTALAALPATVIGILTVNLLGGKILLVSSIFACALSAFLIRVVPARERNIVILASLFNGVSTLGWSALDIITTGEIFPLHLRSTAFGVQAVFGRIGAILGNIAFGRLITLDPMIPILMVAALLLVGGVTALFLPSPPGASIGHNLRKVWRKCSCCFGGLCWPFRKAFHGRIAIIADYFRTSSSVG